MRMLAIAFFVVIGAAGSTIHDGDAARSWHPVPDEDVIDLDFAGLAGQNSDRPPEATAAATAMLTPADGTAPVLFVLASEPELVRLNPTTQDSRTSSEQMPHARERGLTLVVGLAFLMMSLFGRTSVHRRNGSPAKRSAEAHAWQA